MKKLPFKKIDAFAGPGAEGNPAGYILLDHLEDLSSQEMLQIAWELRGYVNEVGFAAPRKDGGYHLRYYSAEREVDFCGHATIAIAYDLITTQVELQDKETFPIATKDSLLEAVNRTTQEDCVYIYSPQGKWLETPSSSESISEALGITNSELATSYPIAFINAGLNTLLVPIQAVDTLLNLSPKLNTLKEFCLSNGIDIIEVFCEETTQPDSHFRVRVFAPTFGYLEDPATGSGNSALGYYLLSQGHSLDEPLKIEQNALRDFPNRISLGKQKDKSGQDRILFGGKGVLRIQGEYYLKR